MSTTARAGWGELATAERERIMGALADDAWNHGLAPLRAALRGEGPIDGADPKGRTALIWGASMGDVRVVALAVRAGADLNRLVHAQWGGQLSSKEFFACVGRRGCATLRVPDCVYHVCLCSYVCAWCVFMYMHTFVCVWLCVAVCDALHEIAACLRRVVYVCVW